MPSAVYRCTGSCHGVSPIEKNCGAPTCDRYEKPLTAVMPCEGCAADASRDGKPHACPMCEPV